MLELQLAPSETATGNSSVLSSAISEAEEQDSRLTLTNPRVLHQPVVHLFLVGETVEETDVDGRNVATEGTLTPKWRSEQLRDCPSCGTESDLDHTTSVRRKSTTNP